MLGTKFARQVKDPPLEPKTSGLRVLVEGKENKKLGDVMSRGRWKGLKLYALTLEERATCPTTCANLARCYGNNMPFAIRYNVGEQLENAIASDLMVLQTRRFRAPIRGILVRLHVLGDFYDAQYVQFWEDMLAQFSRLHLYGYTHREWGSAEAAALLQLVQRFPDRAVFRRSDRVDPLDPFLPAQTVVAGAPAAPGTVVCPEQTGRVPNCAACGLCMNTVTGITFWDHSHSAQAGAAIA